MTDRNSPPPLDVIFNPRAGHASRERLEQALTQELGDAYVLHETTASDPGGGIARAALASGAHVIAAAGGDGTISAVADALAGKDADLAILPCGTANLIAADLGIPEDLGEAVRLALSGPFRVRRLDAMFADGRHYFSHISLGTYAELAANVGAEQKRRLGFGAYLVELARLALRGKRWKFGLEVDGVRERVRGSVVLVANVAATGVPSIEWGPQIQADDGKLSVAIVRAGGPTGYLRLLLAAARREHERSPEVEYREARRSIRITGPRRRPVRADGETISSGSVEIELRPGALRVRAPLEEDSDTKAEQGVGLNEVSTSPVKAI